MIATPDATAEGIPTFGGNLEMSVAGFVDRDAVGVSRSNPAYYGAFQSEVNQVPVLAAIESTSIAFAEGAPAVSITSTLTVTDDGDIASATVSITSGFASGEDTLEFTDQNGITGSFNSTTGVLTLTGTTTAANYQTALRSVGFVNASQDPTTGTRTVSFVVNDGTSDSNAQTRSVIVSAVNDGPVLVQNNTLTVSEGSTGNVITSALLQATDVDNTASEITYTIEVTESNGTFRLSGAALSGGSTFTQDDINNNRVTYDHDGSDTTSDFFDFQVTDGTAFPATDTFNVTVTAVDDTAPVLASGVAHEGRVVLTFTEGESTPLSGTSGFTIQIDGTTVPVLAGVWDGLQLTLFFDGVNFEDQTVTVAATSSNVQDAAGNSLADFTAVSVGNSSEATQSGSSAQEVIDALFASSQWTTLVADVDSTKSMAVCNRDALVAIRGKGYEPPVTISQQEKALSFVSTIDLSNVLTTGDVPAKVGDTITKLISGSTTWNSVGTPRLVDVPGRTLPGIELDGASGFVADTSPLSGDNANGGVFVCGFTRKGDSNSTQMVLGGTSTASTTTNKLLFVTRQATNARNTGLVGLQTGSSLRTFQASDIAGRQNAKSRVIWESDGAAYTLKTQSGTHAVSGTDDGIWVETGLGPFSREVATIGFSRTSSGDTQFFNGIIDFIGWFDETTNVDLLEHELDAAYPTRSVMLLGDSRFNRDTVLSELDQRADGNNYREIATGGDNPTDCLEDYNAAIAAGQKYTDVCVLCAVNRTSANTSAADTLAELQTLFDAITDENLWICNETPFAGANNTTTVEVTEQRMLAAALADEARTRENAILIDTYGGMEDPGNPDHLRADETGDGLHPNATGDIRLTQIISTEGFAAGLNDLSGIAELIQGVATRAEATADKEEVVTAIAAIELATLEGPNNVTITVDDGTNAVENATVRVSQGGQTESKQTNSSGQVTFTIDSATWTVSISANGFTGQTNALIVGGDASQTYSLELISVTGSEAPLSTVVVTCRDEQGQPQAGVEVFMAMINPPDSDSGNAFDGGPQSAVSAQDGVATLTGVRSAKYNVWRGDTRHIKEITIDEADVTLAESWIGVP
ncbi:MAG: cadherin-like domain-containing protein [Planctomycetota bacterium]